MNQILTVIHSIILPETIVIIPVIIEIFLILVG